MRHLPHLLESSPGDVMEVRLGRVMVGYVRRDDPAAADGGLSGLGLMIEQQVEPYRPAADHAVRLRRPLNRTATRMWARTVDGTAFRAGSFRPPEQIIEWIAPIYRLESQVDAEPFAFLPHVLMIR